MFSFAPAGFSFKFGSDAARTRLTFGSDAGRTRLTFGSDTARTKRFEMQDATHYPRVRGTRSGSWRGVTGIRGFSQNRCAP